MGLALEVAGNNLNTPFREGIHVLDGGAVQIISSASVRGGVYCYGKVVGVISSIGIVILLIVAPLFYVFKVVYKRIQTHSNEIRIIRGNLAENRRQAIKKVIPNRELVSDDLRMNQSEYMALIERGFTPKEVQEKVNLLAEGKHIPGLRKEFYVLSDGCCTYDAAAINEFSRLSELIGMINVGTEVIECLAEKGKNRRSLEKFLLKNGALGNDPESEAFKSGMELVRVKIRSIHEENLIKKANAIINAIENCPREGLEDYLQKEVRERIDSLLQTTTYQFLLKSEKRTNQFVRLIQDLAVAVRLDSHGVEQLHLLGSKYLKIIKKEGKEIPNDRITGFLADVLDDTIRKHHWSYKIESLFDKLLVYARYPEKTAMAAMSHRPAWALDYNSYQVGNHDMAYGNYSLGGLKMRAIHGPRTT